MIGTARQCQHCKDVFTFRCDEGLALSLAGMYIFLVDFKKHVKICGKRFELLNEAGLFYLGLNK